MTTESPTRADVGALPAERAGRARPRTPIEPGALDREIRLHLKHYERNVLAWYALGLRSHAASARRQIDHHGRAGCIDTPTPDQKGPDEHHH